MNRIWNDNVFRWIVGTGLAAAFLLTVIFSIRVGTAAAVGCMLAAGNWVALRWVGAKMASNHVKLAGVVFVYFLKMVGLFGLMAIALSTLKLHALGFIVGLSTLVIGILAGSLLHSAPSSVPGGD